MRAELIFTGTDLLSGQVDNSHASFLINKLSALGIEVTRHTTVGERRRIKAVLEQALVSSDLVIITGGHDSNTYNLTKEVVVELLGTEVLLDDGSDLLKESYHSREGHVPGLISRLDNLPAGARLLTHYLGTPGVLLKTGGCIIILLPGSSPELKCVFKESVEAYLASLEPGGTVIRSRLIRVTGISVELVQRRIKGLIAQDNTWLDCTPKPGEVQIRVFGSGANGNMAMGLLSSLFCMVRDQLADFIFSYDDQSPEDDVGNLLANSGMTLALAESCTGGMIAERITRVPGSSGYFLGGVVAYDNMVKHKLLGVAEDTLADWGAVSAVTAGEMARGVRRALSADVGLAVTGIAGPGGGTLQKPVGLVYIAMAVDNKTIIRDFIFPGGRQGIRIGTVNAALHMVKIYLENKKSKRST